jgi:hypothetical protein
VNYYVGSRSRLVRPVTGPSCFPIIDNTLVQGALNAATFITISRPRGESSIEERSKGTASRNFGSLHPTYSNKPHLLHFSNLPFAGHERPVFQPERENSGKLSRGVAEGRKSSFESRPLEASDSLAPRRNFTLFTPGRAPPPPPAHAPRPSSLVDGRPRPTKAPLYLIRILGLTIRKVGDSG